ncbi:MAG: ABC transporter ATP-binding protein/permease [Lachnospiraceae bacterium]|nr:ABC transporter ATP-binding protein/permease [Lachnospiraceae bacterium]
MGQREDIMEILKYIGKYKKLIFLALIAGALCAGCGVAGSEILKHVIDGLEAGTLTNIGHIIFMCICILIAGAGSAWITRYASGSMATKLLRQVKDDAVVHITRMTTEFMSKNRSGDLLSRLTDDVNRISGFVQNDLIYVIMNPFLIIFYFAYLLYINVPLFLISIVPVILCLPFGAALTTKFKAGSKAYMQYSADIISEAADIIGGMDVVKSYSLQDTLLEDYRKNVKKMTNMAILNDKNQSKGGAFYILSGTLSSILCLVAGGWFCLQGRLTIGSLVAFFSLLPKMVEAINDTANRTFNSKVALAAVERVFEILNAPVEPMGNMVSGIEDAPAIEFRDVSFSYEEGVPVLNGTNFKVPRGKTVAVVGASGGGKSTLLRLLCGFYQPQQGSILIEGVKLEDWNLEALRSRFSYVSQHAYLFPVSVGENIAMGKSGADDDEIHMAAEAANASDFISELPEKYDTLAGERGSRLSGGQVQRISIARAILKDAPILLLDEATSALDVAAEAEVQKALDGLMKGRTTLVVAHRLSTIKNADYIVVIERGRVAESGTHEELMERGRVYPKLYSIFAAGGEV